MIGASPFVYVANVKESIENYQRIFGGEIKILNEHAGKMLHAELHLGSSLIHFSDTYGRIPTSENVCIILQLESEEEIRKVYDSLIKEGGTIKVELVDTFFGALHGQVIDQNKINWILNWFKKAS